MNIDEIIKYVMSTSNNPNPAVLQDILKDISNQNTKEVLEDFARDNLFFVTFTIQPYGNRKALTGDKLGSDISDAFDSGKIVVAFLPEYTIDELFQIGWDDMPKWSILNECARDDHGNYWLIFVPELSFNSTNIEGYPFEVIYYYDNLEDN